MLFKMIGKQTLEKMRTYLPVDRLKRLEVVPLVQQDPLDVLHLVLHLCDLVHDQRLDGVRGALEEVVTWTADATCKCQSSGKALGANVTRSAVFFGDGSFLRSGYCLSKGNSVIVSTPTLTDTFLVTETLVTDISSEIRSPSSSYILR
jgi:hypothetical protein